MPKSSNSINGESSEDSNVTDATLAARGNLRPGGRTERVRQAVAKAVLELLETGNGNFSVREVADKSGVSRSTIYARWPSKEALISEALTLHCTTFKFKPGRNWQETLWNFAIAFRDFAAHPIEMTLNRLTTFMESDFLSSETNRIWGEAAKNLSPMVLEAQEKGEIRADINPHNIVSNLMITISGLVTMAKIVPDDAFVADLVKIHVQGSLKDPSKAEDIPPMK